MRKSLVDELRKLGCVVAQQLLPWQLESMWARSRLAAVGLLGGVNTCCISGSSAALKKSHITHNFFVATAQNHFVKH